MLFKPKYYSKCSNLPVKVFFDILEEKNVRLLLVSGFIRKKRLEAIWEGILREYEQLTNNNDYSNNLKQSNNELIKVNRINSLIGLFWLKHLNPEQEFNEFEDYWGVKNQDLEQIKTRILQERTKLQIDQLKRKGKENLNKPNENMDIFDVKLIVEYNLNKDHLDLDKIVVTEWVKYCKEAFKKSTHGRREDKSE